MKAKELEKELARKNSVFEDEDQGIGSSDEGEQITTAQVGDTSTKWRCFSSRSRITCVLTYPSHPCEPRDAKLVSVRYFPFCRGECEAVERKAGKAPEIGKGHVCQDGRREG